VNIPRQCLENAFGKINKAMLEAHKAGDAVLVEKYMGQMSEILDDVDRLVAADSYFLLGKWIDDARGFGIDDVEKAYYEWDARNIITTWGGRGQKLNDYANRTYAGLVRDYYKPRWEIYFDALKTSLAAGTPVDEDALLNALLDYEWAWVSRTDTYPSTPSGDPGRLCRDLYSKWNETVAEL
jgi:alpha-N-acetylglucosaminidase